MDCFLHRIINIYIYLVPSEIQFTDERFLRSTAIAFEDTMCIYLSFRNVRKFSHVPRCALRGLLQEFNLRCQVIPARENVYWIRRWLDKKGNSPASFKNLRFHVVNTRQGGKKNLRRNVVLRTANTPRYKSCSSLQTSSLESLRLDINIVAGLMIIVVIKITTREIRERERKNHSNIS